MLYQSFHLLLLLDLVLLDHIGVRLNQLLLTLFGAEGVHKHLLLVLVRVVLVQILGLLSLLPCGLLHEKAFDRVQLYFFVLLVQNVVLLILRTLARVRLCVQNQFSTLRLDFCGAKLTWDGGKGAQH